MMPISRRLFAVTVVLTAMLSAQDRGEDLEKRVDAYLGPMVEMGLYSGTVLLAQGGEVLVERAYGMDDHEAGIANTIDTRFKLMSTSKTFAGVAVLQLVQAGKLALADPVAKHLSDWPAAWSKVTVHDLLDHTSGIPNLEGPWGQVSVRLTGWPTTSGKPDLFAIWRAFAPAAERPLLHDPGAEFRYSNFNTVMAGVVAAAVSGELYADLVRSKILAPAGLEHTGFDDGARHDGLAIGYFRSREGGTRISEQCMSHIQPAGGLYSTVGDLCRFDRALCDDTLLGDAARARLVTPKNGTYACCWFNQPIHGHVCWQHSGGANGYVADLLRFPEDDACVVVLSNYAFAPISRISTDLAGILFGVEVSDPVTVTEAELDAAAGVYSWGSPDTYMVLRRSGRCLLAFDVRPGHEKIGGRMLLSYGDGQYGEMFGSARLFLETERDPPRVRRQWGEEPGQANLMPRVRDAAESWRGALGELRRPDGTAWLVAEEGQLWLSFASRDAREDEVVPVSNDLAMALYDGAGGTLLRRDGAILRWSRPGGGAVELRPR